MSSDIMFISHLQGFCILISSDLRWALTIPKEHRILFYIINLYPKYGNSPSLLYSDIVLTGFWVFDLWWCQETINRAIKTTGIFLSARQIYTPNMKSVYVISNL